MPIKEFVLPFSKLNNKSVKIAGGKGASLGEMTQAKLNVPPGYVVLVKNKFYILQSRPITTL